MTRVRARGPRRLWVATLAVLASASSASAARAATGIGAAERPRQLEAAARAHHQRGESLYVAELYPQALAEFEAGFAALPLPGFLVNIGQCHRRMGDLTGARAAFERFLVQAPDSPLAPEVRSLIRELVLTPPPLAPFVMAPAPVPAPAPAVPAPPPAPAETSLVAVPARAPAPSASEVVGQRVRAGAAPAAPARRRRPPALGWWVWGSVGLTAVVVSAIVLGAGGGTSTTIHDGSLGTLRR